MQDITLIHAVRARLADGYSPTIEQTLALLHMIDELGMLYTRVGQAQDAMYAALESCGLHIICVQEEGRSMSWAYQWDSSAPVAGFSTPAAAIQAGLQAQRSVEKVGTAWRQIAKIK